MKIHSLAALGGCLFATTIFVAVPSQTGTTLPFVFAQSAPRSWNETDTPRFSVRYPAQWFISSASEDTLILYNQKPTGKSYPSPPYMVKTDIGFTPVSFSEATRPSGGQGMPSKVIKRETLTVNGKQAIRTWRELDDAFTNAISTHIRYNDQETAYAVSFYNRENQAAEAIIISVHNSLTLRF